MSSNLYLVLTYLPAHHPYLWLLQNVCKKFIFIIEYVLIIIFCYAVNTVKKSRILVNPGKSMVEWMKIQRQLEGKGSNDNKLLRKIGPDELASHNTVGDVWMAINGTYYTYRF